jgi:hypothetical protein
MDRFVTNEGKLSATGNVIGTKLLENLSPKETKTSRRRKEHHLSEFSWFKREDEHGYCYVRLHPDNIDNSPVCLLKYLHTSI